MPKQRYVIVLAANPQESHRYARRAGIPARNYRAPASAASVRGIQSADVHRLPSFATRRDRHAIMAELRYARDITYIDVEMPQPAPKPNEQLVVLDIAPDGSLIEAAGLLEELPVALQAETIAAIREVVVDVPLLEMVPEPEEAQDGEEAGAPEPSEDPAPVAPRRRRARCKDCGTLHFADESCHEPETFGVTDDAGMWT